MAKQALWLQSNYWPAQREKCIEFVSGESNQSQLKAKAKEIGQALEAIQHTEHTRFSSWIMFSDCFTLWSESTSSWLALLKEVCECVLRACAQNAQIYTHKETEQLL